MKILIALTLITLVILVWIAHDVYVEILEVRSAMYEVMKRMRHLEYEVFMLREEKGKWKEKSKNK